MPCPACGGSGKTGLLGKQGLGLIEKECRECGGTGAECRGPLATPTSHRSGGSTSRSQASQLSCVYDLPDIEYPAPLYRQGVFGKDGGAQDEYYSCVSIPDSDITWAASCVENDLANFAAMGSITPKNWTMDDVVSPGRSNSGASGTPSEKRQPRPDGEGCKQWSDGASYKGQFRGGRMNGAGCLSLANGSVYTGHFADNAISGAGVFQWSDGSLYEGQWSGSKMHGKGVFTWGDGRAYEGEYRNDLKHGHGTFSWPDGRRLEGQWREGQQHGTATHSTASGEKRIGEWDMGRRTRWVRPQTDQRD